MRAVGADLGIAARRVDPFARGQRQRRVEVVGRRADVEELGRASQTRAPLRARRDQRRDRAAADLGRRRPRSDANAAASATWTPMK